MTPSLSLFLALCLGQVDAIHDDLLSLPKEVWPLVSYLDISNIPKNERELVIKVLSGHINSLSQEPDITHPVVVKDDLLRINLLDYGWDRKVWNEFGKTDPYFHIEVEEYPWGGGLWPGTNTFYPKGAFRVKDKKRILAPWVAETEEEKRKLGVILSYIQSDSFLLRADWWFVNTSTQEGRTVGYYGLLGLKDQKDFERVTRFNKGNASKLEQLRVVTFSGISLQPRRIERTATVLGGLYKTGDNQEATGKKNPLVFVDDEFEFDATEQFAPLPNGLPVWWLGNSKGVRQDKAPDNIVGGDRTGREGNDTRLHINLSCIRCHMSRKEESCIKPIEETKIANIYSSDYEKVREIQRKYFRELAPHIETDRKGYERAIKDATYGLSTLEYSKGYGALYSKYEDAKVDIILGALSLNTSPEKFKGALVRQKKITGNLHPVLSVIEGGGEIPIRQWEEVYGVAQTLMRGIQP